MVSEPLKAEQKERIKGVLILVVMEDGLRDTPKVKILDYAKWVLILVVMEDGLRGESVLLLVMLFQVLILVVMEDGLRDYGSQGYCISIPWS